MPAIVAGPEPLNFGFEFLRQVNPPKSYAIPTNLPVLRPLGKLRQLGSLTGTEHIWKPLHPLYPVQVVPQLEILITRHRVQFSELCFSRPEVRVYLHPFGYLATFRTQLVVSSESPAISGLDLARVIYSIEHNRTLKIASRAFKGVRKLDALFPRLFDCVSRQMFSSPVQARSQVHSRPN